MSNYCYWVLSPISSTFLELLGRRIEHLGHRTTGIPNSSTISSTNSNMHMWYKILDISYTKPHLILSYKTSMKWCLKLRENPQKFKIWSIQRCYINMQSRKINYWSNVRLWDFLRTQGGLEEIIIIWKSHLKISFDNAVKIMSFFISFRQNASIWRRIKILLIWSHCFVEFSPSAPHLVNDISPKNC